VRIQLLYTTINSWPALQMVGATATEAAIKKALVVPARSAAMLTPEGNRTTLEDQNPTQKWGIEKEESGGRVGEFLLPLISLNFNSKCFLPSACSAA